MNSISSLREDYLSACLEAARDETAFSRFRQHPAIEYVMEHVSEAQGSEMLNNIRSKNPRLFERITSFSVNDKHGGPKLIMFPGVGEFSPVTLRYINILGQLETYFGSLDGKRIVEIGGGYGGQAMVICSHFQIADYLIHDLPPVTELQQAFLQREPCTQSVRFCNAPSPTGKYDLVVSNYAFSECDCATQEAYLETVLLQANAGYMICNFLDPAATGIHSMSKQQITKSIPGSRFISEVPSTHPGNAVLVWGNAN